tara:strand:+ start:114 stop:290 length:177 start_codon:yes stop_codon:yes gene_type:complete
MEFKQQIIENIQHLANKIYNKEVSKKHYSSDRLQNFSTVELINLQTKFKTELWKLKQL